MCIFPFWTGPPGVSLSICEAFVYTDQALPIERCPTFRDQPPGSTATYNGKCYIFYNSAPTNFQDAMDFCSARGGTLVDESNPALQGFLSWELWRRHKVIYLSSWFSKKQSVHQFLYKKREENL